MYSEPIQQDNSIISDVNSEYSEGKNYYNISFQDFDIIGPGY